MKIAIIGSGIAGLTVSWLASRSGQHVTLFEQHPTLGMDAHSIEFPWNGATQRIDVPPRMFNADEWPRLTGLYRLLGVETQPVDASKSFTIENERSWLQLGDSYIRGLAPKFLLNAKARAVAKDILRLKSWATSESIDSLEIDLTLRQFLNAGGYSAEFVFDFLYPALAATVFTCSYDALDCYPAKVALKSLLNLFDQSPLRRTTNGTRDVVDKLSSSIDSVRTSTTVTGFEQDSDGVRVAIDRQACERFDHLVIATQANSAARILKVSDPAGVFDCHQELLNEFQYQTVPVVVHTDSGLMPKDSADWKCFNFISSPDEADTQCTIWLNRFYERGEPEASVFQTIRPTRPVDPQHVLATATMQRPVVDAKSVEAVEKLGQLQRASSSSDRRVWFCGSYAGPGVPLLESGVSSAMMVASRLGVSVPAELKLRSATTPQRSLT